MSRKILKITAAKRQHRTSRLIAQNLKTRRRQVAMKLTTLASRMAVTERQVLRWESGETPISCGALAMMARVLCSMPGDFFLKDFPGNPPVARPTRPRAKKPAKAKRVAVQRARSAAWRRG